VKATTSGLFIRATWMALGSLLVQLVPTYEAFVEDSHKIASPGRIPVEDQIVVHPVPAVHSAISP
jgi:hypothetical protein